MISWRMDRKIQTRCIEWSRAYWASGNVPCRASFALLSRLCECFGFRQIGAFISHILSKTVVSLYFAWSHWQYDRFAFFVWRLFHATAGKRRRENCLRWNCGTISLTRKMYPVASPIVVFPKTPFFSRPQGRLYRIWAWAKIYRVCNSKHIAKKTASVNTDAVLVKKRGQRLQLLSLSFSCR